ncbi:hypothetical protein EV401DRAFT_2010906 [Pisolithus croceorrhizus]|nr:hypothetical protein EV401DRAFT_2010906 [Pisolithus croceorrhizus]
MLSRRLLEAGLLPLICRQTDTLIFVTVDSQSSSSSDVTLPAVVLQTYSTPTEDIVLTTLDLLTLEDVVRALDEKLPRRMSISVAVERGDQWVGDDDNHDDIKVRLRACQM